MRFQSARSMREWRMLLREVAIVIFGVIIALAAQRWVENLDWKHEVDTERKALLDEFAWSNLTSKARLMQ